MNKQIRGLHEAAYLLAVFSFLSQILALIRDRAFAHLFGASAILDAYFAAFRIPDIVFALFTLFVSSFALVPMFAERGGPTAGASRRLLGSVLFFFGLAGAFFGLALFALAPTLIPLLFPGFSIQATDDIVALSRIMLLQPVLLGLSSVVSSVIQSSQKFFLFALAPIFYNIGIIFGALFLYPTLGITGLAWGVVSGALLHFLVQSVPSVLYDRSFLPLPPARPLSDMRRVIALSLPRALALSAQQFLLLVFVGAASLAAVGSVSVMTFGFNLQSVPLSVIGISYAAALFPSLSLLFAKGDRETFVKEVWAAVRHTMLWIMPAIVLIVVLRAHIVRVILGSGAFTWVDTRLTAAVLAGFVVSLVAQTAILIFSRAYYAAGRSWEPIIINVSAALAASAFAAGGMFWFREATVGRFFIEGLFRISGIPGTEVIMIALAYTLVMIVFAFVFAYLFARRFGFEARTLRSLFFSFAASVFAAFAAYGVLQLSGPLLPTDTFAGIFVQGAAAGVFGLLVWAVTLLLLKSRDFSEAIAVFLRLMRKS